MSLKSADQAPRRRSIIIHLVVLYMLTSAVLLLGAMTAIYFAVERHIEDEDTGFLVDRLHTVRVKLQGGDAAMREVVTEFSPPGVGYPEGHFIRVLDEEGNVLAEMPGMAALLPSTLFPKPAPANYPLGETREIKTDGGRWFLLTSALARAGGSNAGMLRIEIAQNRSEDHVFMSEFRVLLGGLLVVGTGVAALLGGTVARRSLRPIEEMAAMVQRIGATELHARIAAAEWPDELTTLAAAFNGMLHRLEEAFTRLSQFSADLAHELRTPVGVLRGETEVALSRSRSAEEYREVLISSIDEFERLSRMIDGLLFIARSENPETRIEAKLVRAREEIEAIFAFHEAGAQEQGVILRLQGDASFDADPTLFRRAVTNLVTNALQHSPGGSTVTVKLSMLGDFAVVRVMDDGPGIAPEHLPNLFDRFYRADPSRHAGGTGLGLAIVKSIMDLHGGSITVSSQRGKGSCFTLSFPQAMGPHMQVSRT